MTRPINLARYRGKRLGLPSQLLLQCTKLSGEFGTVNCIEVIPYTPEGYDDCKAKLEKQAMDWHHNCQDFFGAKWQIVPGGQ